MPLTNPYVSNVVVINDERLRGLGNHQIDGLASCSCGPSALVAPDVDVVASCESGKDVSVCEKLSDMSRR